MGTQLPISYVISHNDETIKKGAVVPPGPPTKPTPQGSSNVGTTAGIVIALILTVVCAALLVVMWKKNLLCPKQGSLDVEKAGAASSDGGLSKPVELDEVEPAVLEPVEETKNYTSDPLLDDDDIKKPPVIENGQTEIIPTNPVQTNPEPEVVNFDDQPPPAP